MAKKMYYSEQEAAGALGIGVEELGRYVRDNRLRVFQDGTQRMFKAAEVDALAAELGGGDDDEIELSPADSQGTGVSLADADAVEPPKGKEDTVITSEGISIFDDEDLEVEAADPMAKTQIAPSLEEQMSMEGVGSGSGLLDLTRESDDTSLGAEVLDHIDMDEGIADGEIDVPEETAGAGAYAPAAAPVLVPVAQEEIVDASSGFFGGAIIGSAIVALVILALVPAAMQGVVPGYVAFMKENMLVVLGASVVTIVVCAIVGMMVGKAVAARRLALGRMAG